MTKVEKSRFWKQHIESQRRSGQTQRSYCGENSININTFNWWKKKLKADSPKKNIKSVKKSVEKESNLMKTFIPIQLRQSVANKAFKGNLIELTLSEDMELSLSFKVNINGLGK